MRTISLEFLDLMSSEVHSILKHRLAMNLREKINQDSPNLCKRFGIKRLGLFGSVARGDSSITSDIDFFAEFADPTPEHMPERYFGFLKEAEMIFQRPIQLLTPRMIKNPFLRRSIDRDLVIIYE